MSSDIHRPFSSSRRLKAGVQFPSVSSSTFGPGVSANGSVVTGFSVDDHGILSTLQQNQNMYCDLSLKIMFGN